MTWVGVNAWNCSKRNIFSLRGFFGGIIMNNYSKLSERQMELMSKKMPKKIKIAGVDSVILVASAKGGVGKSTTAVNLALALNEISSEKYSVGLLDMDVFGPSLPLMMNLSGSPELDGDNRMMPLVNFGIKCMSIGFLVKEKDAIVWRGPMVISAVQQLLLKTNWGKLRHLILDLPPGTGDVPLSICQLIHVEGALLVSTPQEIALADVKRGAEMFRKLGVPLLGIIDNMSSYQCPKCGHVEHIFGNESIRNLSQNLGVDIIASVPFDISIRTGCDKGKPVVITDHNGAVAHNYIETARKIVTKLSEL